MRIPRDVNGQLLAERLQRHGYVLTASSSTSRFRPTSPSGLAPCGRSSRSVASQVGTQNEELISSLDL